MLFYWPYALPAAECVLPWKMPVLTACFPVLSNFVPDFFPHMTRREQQGCKCRPLPASFGANLWQRRRRTTTKLTKPFLDSAALRFSRVKMSVNRLNS